LEYVPIPWEQALERWKSIPWLQLGVSNRADWIANGLVVVPIGYSLSGYFSYKRRFRYYHLGYYVMLIFSMSMLIVGIEMLQAYFPRRTMSINDIVAGWIGALLGVFSWFAVGQKSTDFIKNLLALSSISQRIQAIALVGCIAGVLYSLFPFDFVISRDEFFQKIADGRIGFLGVAQEGVNFESIKGAISSWIRMIPFGVYLGSSSDRRKTIVYLILIPFLLELIQIPVFSKYSSITDWGMGSLGGLFGVGATRRKDLWEWILRQRLLWVLLLVTWTAVLYAIYIGVFPFASGRSFLVDSGKISARWQSFVTPPFLRYYFPSEYSALTNFLGKALTFSVLGLITGAIDNTFPKDGKRTRQKWILGGILLVCVSVELGQIYVEEQVADSTDILIYLLGGFLGVALFNYIIDSERRTTASVLTNLNEQTPSVFRYTHVEKGLGGFLVFLGLWLSATHPGWPVIQASLTLLVAATVYFRWALYSFIYVMLLICGDAYPLTGQLVFQEYDSLLLAATGSLLGSGAIQLSTTSRRVPFLYGVGWALLGLALLVGLFVGVYRLPGADFGDQLSVYFNKWNAVRVSKGLFWGLCFFYLTCTIRTTEVVFWRRNFVLGMVASSLYVGIWIVVERAIFPGIFNLSELYRATGPFFTMHIGDQHIDAFLVIAFPIACGMLINELKQIGKAVQFTRIAIFFGITLLLAHGVFATMSRGPVLAVGIQSLFLIPAAFLHLGRVKRVAYSRIAILCLPLSGLFFLVFYSVIASRFSSFLEDTTERINHWAIVITKGSTGIGGTVIGHGAGCFPSMMAIEKGYTIPPLNWERNETDGRIRVHSGWPIFLDRFTPEAPVRFTGKARVENASALKQEISFYCVEKSLLHSYRYKANRITLSPNMEVDIDWPNSVKGTPITENSLSSIRPVYIGVSSPEQGDLILRNASDYPALIYQRTSYPWIFTCDDHLVWRAKNFLVHAYYEQGLVGVLGWLLVFASAFARGIMQIGCRESSEQLLSWIAVSILGFFIVGMFGTLIDTPWISALVLGCTALVCQSSNSPSEPVSRRPANV